MAALVWHRAWPQISAMAQHPHLPEDLRARAGFLTITEQDELWRAAVLMADSRGLLMRMSALFGRRVEDLRSHIFKTGTRVGGASWADLNNRVQEAVEDILWNAYEVATFGLEETPQILRPKAPRGNTLHRLATTASGGASGFVGLPGILLDIPFTTTMILRTIAEVARDHGESLTSEDTKRACLDVLVLGGLSEADEDSETGYWTARLGMNHLALSVLIKSAAARFGLVLSEKLLAQAVPVVGAVSGAALNYGFTSHYQKMAQVQFCVRAVERRAVAPARVRQCFDEMVSAARARRKLGRRQPTVAERVLIRG